MLETLEEEPRLKHLLLARKYGMMGLSKHLRHHLREAEKKKGEQAEQLIDPYLVDYFGQYIRMQALMSNASTEPVEEALNSLFESLDRHYGFTRLRLLLERYNRLQLLGKTDKLENLKTQIIATAEPIDDPAVTAYAKLLRLLEDCPPEEYFELRRALDDGSYPLPRIYRDFSDTYCINYCIKRVQLHKDPRFAKEFICIFDQLAKDNRHLDKGGLISVERLVKCIVFGIIAGEMEWLEAMLDRLEAQIDLEGEEERQAFRSFANCYIDIHRGTTGRAYEDLRRFRESRLYRKYYALKAGADRLLLKLYFEKGEHEALASLMNSVRVSVEKSGFGEDKKKGMLAFFEVLFELNKNKKPLTWELARGWHLIDQVWAKRICQ